MSTANARHLRVAIAALDAAAQAVEAARALLASDTQPEASDPWVKVIEHTAIPAPRGMCAWDCTEDRPIGLLVIAIATTSDGLSYPIVLRNGELEHIQDAAESYFLGTADDFETWRRRERRAARSPGALDRNAQHAETIQRKAQAIRDALAEGAQRMTASQARQLASVSGADWFHVIDAVQRIGVRVRTVGRRVELYLPAEEGGESC